MATVLFHIYKRDPLRKVAYFLSVCYHTKFQMCYTSMGVVAKRVWMN